MSRSKDWIEGLLTCFLIEEDGTYLCFITCLSNGVMQTYSKRERLITNDNQKQEDEYDEKYRIGNPT